MTAIGGAIGLGLALPLTESPQCTVQWHGFLVSPSYTSSFRLAIVAVSILATYIPARRAASVDPTIALRNS